MTALPRGLASGTRCRRHHLRIDPVIRLDSYESPTDVLLICGRQRHSER